MNNYIQLILFIVLIEKFDKKLKFRPWLAWIRSYKWVGPKHGENMVLKSQW